MCELHLKILPMCRIETLLYRLINVCFLSHLFPLLIATLSAPLVMWRHPDKAPQRKCGMQTVKGAAGQLPMEQEQVGRPAETVLLIPPRHRSNTNAGVDITAIWMDLPTTVYSRLLSAMCSRLAVGPDRPPSSSSSSPAVWCWNSSLDSSPELEDLSSFWMSLLGSAGASRNRQTCQNVDYMVLKSVIINDLKSAMCGSYSAVIKHLRKSSQMVTWYIDVNKKKIEIAVEPPGVADHVCLFLHFLDTCFTSVQHPIWNFWDVHAIFHFLQILYTRASWNQLHLQSNIKIK